MKIKTTDLWILSGIIGILLISGCIGEKSGEWQETGEEQPGSGQEQEVTIQEEPAGEVNETGPGSKPTGEVNETGHEQEPAGDADEKETVKVENYPGNDWCVPTPGRSRPTDTAAWVEGIVEFKGKQMCHSSYISGTMQYDVYSTINEEEVWRVKTYSNGTVEESKIESPKELEEVESFLSTAKKTVKEPSDLVLELNDLPEDKGYNIIPDKTGATTKEEHTYSPEKLVEVGWEGGYKIVFDNEKLYLFNLSKDYKKYLKEGGVDEQLKKEFKDNKISLSKSDTVYKISDKRWKIQDKDWVRKSKIEFYIIEETGENLMVYEKSVSYIIDYRYIFNTNSVYNPDKIKEVFNDSKQTMPDSFVFVSEQPVGDECMLYKKEFSEGNFNYTVYAVIFRKLNVYEEIQVMGLSGGLQQREIMELARILAEKIE